MKWKASIRKIFINGEKRELYLKVFNGIPEAPADGEQYVRKDRYWRKIEGAIDVDTEVTETSENPVKSSGIWAFVQGLITDLTTWIGQTFLKIDDLPPIPSDISDLTDTQDIIPPHLFFDDQYFSGAGTEADPYAIPFGSEFEQSDEGVVQINKIDKSKITGLAPEKRFVEIKTTEVIRTINITKWSDGSELNIQDGMRIRIIVDHPMWQDDVTGRVSFRLKKNGAVNYYEGNYYWGTQKDTILWYNGSALVGERQTIIELSVSNQNIYGFLYTKTAAPALTTQFLGMLNNIYDGCEGIEINASITSGFQIGTYIRIEEI